MHQTRYVTNRSINRMGLNINIILLGCCAISIFILFVLITFIKNVDDFAAITNMYDYIRMQNITIKIDTIIFKTIVILSLSRINNAI